MAVHARVRGAGVPTQLHSTWGAERVAEPTAFALAVPEPIERPRQRHGLVQEPRVVEQHQTAEPPSWSETTQLRMELARTRADLVQSENEVETLRERSRQDVQEMLRQLKDSEQQLWKLHARQESKERQRESESSDLAVLLEGFERLEQLVSLVHPERLQEDATDPARPHCRRPQCLEAAPTEPLTGVPQSEDASDVALYVQQSLTWATAVVDRARDQHFQLHSRLRSAACCLLLQAAERLRTRRCWQAWSAWREGSVPLKCAKRTPFHGSPVPRSSPTASWVDRTTGEEHSWQSWQSWVRSAPVSLQKHSSGAVLEIWERDVSDSDEDEHPISAWRLRRLLAKVVGGRLAAQLCKTFLRWHQLCTRRRLALRCLCACLGRQRDKMRQDAWMTWRSSVAQSLANSEQQARTCHQAQEGVLQARLTRVRCYMSAHLLMRVQRACLCSCFRAWAILQRQRQLRSTRALETKLRELGEQYQNALEKSHQGRSSALFKARELSRQRQMLLRVFLALRFQVRLQLARHSPQRPPTALTWKMLQRVFSGWRRVMHGSRVREGQALQKMKVLREGQIVLMEWSAQSRAQKRTARWHAIFVRLYRRVRAHRELILIQPHAWDMRHGLATASLSSWQQYTLRRRSLRHRQHLSGKLLRASMAWSLQRCFSAWACHSWPRRCHELLGRLEALSARGTTLRRLASAWSAWSAHVALAKKQRAAGKMLVCSFRRGEHFCCLEILRCWARHTKRLRRRDGVLGRHQVLRLAFVLWRRRWQRSRLMEELRRWPRSHPAASWKRILLRAWQAHVQASRSAKVQRLGRSFHAWALEVAQRQTTRAQQLRFHRVLRAARAARSLMLAGAVMSCWSMIARLGRQAERQMSLMVSSRQWQSAAVAARNHFSLARAWRSWADVLLRRRQARLLDPFLGTDHGLLVRAFRGLQAACRLRHAPRPKRPCLEFLGTTVRLSICEDWWLARLAWDQLRYQALDSKCQRLHREAGELSQQFNDLQSSKGLLQHRLELSLRLHQKGQEQQLLWCCSPILNAWQQVVVSVRLRMRQSTRSAFAPARALAQMRLGFCAWKAWCSIFRAAWAMSRTQDRKTCSLMLLRWSQWLAHLKHREELRDVALRAAKASQLLLLQKLFCHWCAVLANVNQHIAVLRRNALAATRDQHETQTQLQLLWALWRSFAKWQQSETLHLQQLEASWARLTAAHVARRAAGVLQSWRRWLHCVQARRQVSAALALKVSSTGGQSVGRCWRAWTSRASKRRKLRERLLRWSSGKVFQTLRSFWHAWRVGHLQLMPMRRRKQCISTRVLRRSADLAWLRLVLWTWSTKGRRDRAGPTRLVLHAWHCRVLQLRSARSARHQRKQACAILAARHQRHSLVLCFYILRMDALLSRVAKAQDRLAEVRKQQLRQERLWEETRRQRAARNLEELNLKARSYSDGKLPFPLEPTTEPSVVVEPTVVQPRPPMPRSRTEPTGLRRPPAPGRDAPPAAPRDAAPHATRLVPMADRALVDLLQHRGAIDEALGQSTDRPGVSGPR
ncbi:unnamed protein product [Durusdinium trenchii]|uniref:Uncharacterized protein n=1 Tax=Durusdinium trenchii TaxID=1381693 RepID=A0ABP0Q9R6_9DINO